MKSKYAYLPAALSLAFATLKLSQAQTCAPGVPIKPFDFKVTSREAVATLIGYSEFTNPSTPPKKYRRHQITGVMNAGTFYDSPCNTGDESISVAETFVDGLVTETGQLDIFPVSSTATTVLYQISYSSSMGPDNTKVAMQFPWGTVVASGNPAAVEMQRGWSAECFIIIWKPQHGGWVGLMPSKHLVAQRIESYKDTWDLDESYGKATGALTSANRSTRYTGPGFPLMGGKLSATGPSFGDYSMADVGSSVSSIERIFTGNETCRSSSGVWLNYAGHVNERLSDEDTEEDAEARATFASGDSNIAYRSTRGNGFTFGFRQVDYNARFNLCTRGDYNLYIVYTEAAHGSTAASETKRRFLEMRPLEGGTQEVSGTIKVQIGEGPFSQLNTDYAIHSIEAEPVCGVNEVAGGGAALDSAHVWMNMGRTAAGQSAGQLRLDTDTFAAATYMPSSLVVTGASAPGVVVVKVAGVLRQVSAPQVLADIITLNVNAYEVRFYPSSQVGAADVAGVFGVSGAPVVTYRIENPDAPQSTLTRLRMTETRTGVIKITEFGCDPASAVWSFVQGGGLRKESETSRIENGDTIKTKTVTDELDQVASKVARTYHVFPWGQEMIREVSDPDGVALATVFEFYDNVPTSDPNYRHLRQQTPADGDWTRFTYDATGRVLRTIRPFLDAAPATTNESLCRVTENSYDSLGDLDGDGSVEERTTTIERTLGQETARRYRIDWSKPVTFGADICKRRTDAVCVSAGATWNDSTNLVIETLTYSGGTFAGRERRVINGDATVAITSYVMAQSGVLTTTTKIGQANTSNDDVVDGRRMVSVTSAGGQVTSEQVFDVATGLSLSLWVATQFDVLGRPTRLDFDDGTYTSKEYACCGLASERDRTGIITVYSYDPLGRLIATTRNGITTKTVYDAEARPLSVSRVGSDGSEMLRETSVYDLAGRVIESRDALSRLTRYDRSYNAATGRSTSTTTNPDGGTINQETARDGSRTSVGGTAVAPHTFDYGVDALGVFTNDTAVGIDANGRPTFSQWTKTYTDFAGRTSRVVFADGATTRSFYNNFGQLVRQVDPDGVTTLIGYNPRGEQDTTVVDLNVNGVVDFAGTDRIMKTSTAVATKTDSFGSYTVIRTTSQVWEADNADVPITVSISEQSTDGRRSWQTVRGLTAKTLITYDGVGGRTIVSTSPDGVKTTQIYAADRLISNTVTTETNAPITGASYTYDPHGRMQSTTDARNGATTFAYYADDKLYRVTTPDPDPTRGGSGYDRQAVTYTYDVAGRVQTVTEPDGGVVNTTYWPTGAMKLTWGTRTYPVEYSYDSQGRVKTLTTWQNFVGDAGRAVTTWNYNAQRGWLDNKRYSDGSGPSYTYKPSGRLLTRTWARTPLITTTYTYDNAGEVASIDYSDATPDVTMAYDRLGRPKTTTTGSDACAFAYHTSGQLETESYTSGVLNGQSVSRSFDSLQRLEGMSIPSVISIGYSYDGVSRLDTITVGPNTATYRYASNSPLVESITFKNAGTTRAITTKIYDNLTRLTSIISQPSAASALSYVYTYNAANQRTRVMREDNGYWSHSYDALGQVTAGRKYLSNDAPVPGQDYAWTFDDIGNRKTATTNAATASYSANLLNQYTQRSIPGVVDVSGAAEPLSTITVSINNGAPQIIPRQGEVFHQQVPVNNLGAGQTVQLKLTGVKNLAGPNGEDAFATVSTSAFVPQTPETFTHDPDGNLVADARWIYTWDAENRLLSLETNPSAVNAGVARQKLEFTYDVGGRRLAKKVSAWTGSAWTVMTHILFVYDGWNLLAELDALNNRSPIRTYAWGLDVSGGDAAGGVGGLMMITDLATNAVHFTAYDGNGNVGGLVKAVDGTCSAKYDYPAFGEVIAIEGAFASSNPFRFSTKFTDSETGLLYYGYRYYMPGTGRWLNRDSYAEEGGVNLYNFVENASTEWIDPFGLALYAFDGTNNDGYRDESKGHETNVFILAKIYKGNAWYIPGVGTNDGLLNPIGSLFGVGGQARESSMLAKAGEFIQSGDMVADIIGFSRGAAQARDFANKLKEKYPCVKIRWMGLFDTVASEGLPNDVNIGYQLGIPKDTGSVLHLTAGGERRSKTFALTSINSGLNQPNANPNYREQSIPGAVHSDVGGFYGNNRGLANQALQRMWHDGRDHGVPFGPLSVRYTNVTPNGPNDSRWLNDKVVEFLTGEKRVRKIYYHP